MHSTHLNEHDANQGAQLLAKGADGLMSDDPKRLASLLRNER